MLKFPSAQARSLPILLVACVVGFGCTVEPTAATGGLDVVQTDGLSAMDAGGLTADTWRPNTGSDVSGGDDSGGDVSGSDDAGADDAGADDTWGARRAAFVLKDSHESALGDGWMAAGQPSKTRLLDVVGQGATIISLRYKSEEPFDEQTVVTDAGGTFVRYGVQPSQYADKAFRTKLWDLYDAWQAKGGLVYLHCASSNRVGGSWAMYQFERKGVSAAQAYDLGIKAGMTSTSSIVKQVLGL